MATLKEIKETYSEDELIKLTSRYKIKKQSWSVFDFNTLQEVLDEFYFADPSDVMFEPEWDNVELVCSHSVEKSYQERLNEGAKLKQKKLKEEEDQKKKEEKERREYERLKKKFGEG